MDPENVNDLLPEPAGSEGGSDCSGPHHHVGKLVVQAREAARLTQDELAERTGISIRGLSNLERGRVARPRLFTLRGLTKGLGLVEPFASEFVASVRRASGSIAVEPKSATAPDTATSVPPVPAQLPPDIRDFIGYQAELDSLRALLIGARANAMPIASIVGGGGAGKTTLAVHVGHEVRDAYPDGQLYVDLHGTGPTPSRPDDVTASLLRAIGFENRVIPGSGPERSAMFRSATARRRILVILEDALDGDQVRPLLPGGSGCAVLTTSRHELHNLSGAHRVAISVLSKAEAVTLLGMVAGEDRVTATSEAAIVVADACDGLPLAVRIAGQQLAIRRSWTVEDLADRLRSDLSRLNALRLGHLDVRASLCASVTALSEAARDAFMALGLLEHS